MTDLEISKALALAIGWKPDDVQAYKYADRLEVWWFNDEDYDYDWRIFDYRDWNVIGPIAEKFDCFPYRNFREQWTTDWTEGGYAAPQKAIAMAVIGAKK